MRRVDYMVGARDFKTLEAEQFMQNVVNVLPRGRYRR